MNSQWYLSFQPFKIYKDSKRNFHVGQQKVKKDFSEQNLPEVNFNAYSEMIDRNFTGYSNL